MKLKTWIPLGSLVLLLCAHQGESTLILGSMLMAATAAMTGGLIMGPLTVGGLIMMMMMAANQQQQQASQRTQASSTNIASTLENSQNLLQLLSTLTGAASSLATSASTQSNAFANAIQSTTAPKASKRALNLHSPQNLEELLAASSRRTSMNRRQWKSLSRPTTTTTTTQSPRQRANSFFDSHQSEFWDSKQPYFSPDSGYAVEPIPDDLLDIAMRLPQAKSANMFGDFDSFDVTSTSRPTSTSTSEDADISSTTPFGSFMSDLSPPKPIADELRWVASEPGDLFSSFPQITEEDLMSLVRKRATRETLHSKFRLEDIANVTYANDKDPLIQQELSEREKQEIVNTRIFRQLSALDPFRCLPQLACTLQATPPSQQSGLMNDYAYLLKTVFERDEEDDEEDDQKPGASNVKKNAKDKKPSLLSDISALLSPTSTSSINSGSSGNRNKKNKKVLDYKSPTKSSSSSNSKSKNDKPESDKNEEEEEDDDDDAYSSEEIPMNDEELERLMLKEQYEMEQLANEELLNDDPEVLPYVLKSASKAPPYLGPDPRPAYQSAGPSALAVDDGASGVSGAGLSGSGHPSALLGGRFPIRGRDDVGRGPSAMYAQPPPLFTASKLRRYNPEDLDKMSSSELNTLLKQVSYPGEDFRMDDTTFQEEGGKLGVSNVIANLMPKMPDLSFGFSARRRTTGNTAFDDDPFFDDFRRRSLEPFAMQKLRKVKRVVRRVKMEGPPGKLAYVRRMKRQISSQETDPAEIFKIAKEAGLKFKSARQCRFLFSSCPMNSTQLLNMIGNIRNAVINLSNAQQLLAGQAAKAATAAATPAPAKDIVQTLATLGPNVVTMSPTTTTTPVPPPPPPPLPPTHFIQHHHQTHGLHIQPVLPLSPMMPQSPSSSNQNTLVVPQIIQVPMPIQTSQSAPAPQHIILQQPAPQMIVAPQQRDPPLQKNRPNNNIFNIGSSSTSASSEGDGMTSISHELPTGEKLQISMKLTGQQSQQNTGSIPLKTKKKPAYPSEFPRPTVLQPQTTTKKPTPTKSKNPAADLVDLFDDDSSDNFLLPTKALIETEIKEPSTSIDSLQAAILAIEKINQAANEKRKVTTFGEDDEKEDFPVNQKLIASLQKPIVAVPITRKPFVPSGLRLPSRKKNKNKNYSKNKQRPSDDEGDDESSEEEDDEEEEDIDEDGYRRRLPDPMDPHKRDFLPVPTKSAQFSSTLSVPATQTFVKRRLQIDGVDKDSSEETLSNREMMLNKRMGKPTSSSEEDDDEPKHVNPNRRKFTISTTSRSKVARVRKPKILYPQEDLEEKPVFIPL